jgi:hypothetical protein
VDERAPMGILVLKGRFFEVILREPVLEVAADDASLDGSPASWDADPGWTLLRAILSGKAHASDLMSG